MTKPLKYQSLIHELNISATCPFENCKEVNLMAFRWIYLDINHEDNYLPAHEISKKYNRPPRINSDDDLLKCSICALSMFASKEQAFDKFSGLPQRARESLGYTHLASLQITRELGVSSVPSKRTGHFDFFEYADADLSAILQMEGELS